MTEHTFVSTTTGCSYHVRATATCKTRNVIYLIQFRKCKLQYESPLHICLNGHCSDICKLEKTVAAHFNTPGHSTDDLSIMVIEKMKNEDPDLRKKRENYWIDHLQSLIVPTYATTAYATTAYVADVITLDFEQQFFTGHIDVFCLTTYKKYVCVPFLYS